MSTFLNDQIEREIQNHNDIIFECFKLIHDFIEIGPKLLLNNFDVEITNSLNSNTILYDIYSYFISNIFIKNTNNIEIKDKIINHQLIEKLENVLIDYKIAVKIQQKYEHKLKEFYNILHEFKWKSGKNAGIDVELLEKKLNENGIELFDYISICNSRNRSYGGKVKKAREKSVGVNRPTLLEA